MRKILLSSLILLIAVAATLADVVKDPVSDYLLGNQTRAYADNTTRRDPLYQDDAVYRVDLDLNHDGTNEVLVSSKRDRDAKQGSIWTVYRQDGNGFENAGQMTFSQARFYLGDIDEVGRYGLVTFAPAGGGEGTIWAYVFDGSSIQQVKMREVKRDPATMKLEGDEMLQKYLGEKAMTGDHAITTIDADHLASEYGITIESKTRPQAVRDREDKTPNAMPLPSAPGPNDIRTPAPTSDQTRAIAPSLIPQSQGTPAPTLSPSVSERPRPFPWFWAAALVFAAFAVVFAFLRRSRK